MSALSRRRRTTTSSPGALLTATVLACALASAPSYASGLVDVTEPSGASATGAAESARGATEAQVQAQQTLDEVQAMLGVDEVPAAVDGDAPEAGHDLTLALRDLSVQLDDLGRADRREARRILARPTSYYDGDYVAYEPGAELQSTCGPAICVHWVTEGKDAPDLTDSDVDGVPDQAQLTLETMEQVAARVEAMGYRPPLRDNVNVADPDRTPRFDVYLADVGGVRPNPLFGYCAWESKRKYDYAGAGYCVLDDDFAARQFDGADPVESLRVTAAHEYFHAVQFGYDAVEDLWFMEATATWIEDEIYDDLNGNRIYLGESQLWRPGVPLDDPDAALGNWAFFRWLSERYGPQIVLRAWRAADSVGDARDRWGLAAVRAALRSTGADLRDELSAYAVDLRFARDVFDEASESPAWRDAPRGPVIEVTNRQPTSATVPLRVRQIASRSVQIPTSAATSRLRRLVVRVDAPRRERGVRVHLVQVRKNGDRVVQPVDLDRSGDGRARIGFAPQAVEQVLVVAVGTSIRMRCWQGTTFSCEGTRRDDRLPVRLEVEGRR